MLIRRVFLLLAVAVVALGLGTASAATHRSHRRCVKRSHHRCVRYARPRHHKRKHRAKPKPAPTRTTTTTTTTTASTTATTAQPLPSRLEVDENDQGQLPQPYTLRPSHDPVAAGDVHFNVYNFGEDPHTFAVLDASQHQLALVNVPANQSDTAVPVSVNLPAGTYTLECTLSGHAALGMRATLIVK
jgi:plastocyanin